MTRRPPALSRSPATSSTRAVSHDQSSERTLWLFFIALAGSWGSSFLFIKIGVDAGLPPFSLVTGRLAVATLALALLARFVGAHLPRDRGTIARLVLLGVINVAIPFSLITWGERSIPSAVASILNGCVPLFTIAVAAIALHDEPITVNRVLGLLIGFAGAVLILTRPGASAAGVVAAEPSVAGELAVLLAALFYAVSAVFVRLHLGRRDAVVDPVRGPRPLSPVEIALPQNAVALACVAVMAAVTEWAPAGRVVVPPTYPAWLAIVWLGVIGSALAYLLSFRLIERWGPTRATLVTYVFPIVGIALGVLVLGETIDLQAIGGSALVVGGVALVNSRHGRRRLLGRAAAAAPIAVASEER